MTTIPTFIAGLTLAASLFLGSTAGAQATQPPKTEPAKTEAPKTEAPKAEPTKDQEKTVYVLMTTSMGDISIELNNEKAPISTQNFLSYVDKRFYDGTIFHRVISTFMIQGGGFTADMKQKTNDRAIKNESTNGLSNARGTIAMARTSAPDSATSQFFINVENNNNTDMKVQVPNLDSKSGQPGYAVFGKVVSGMDVVDKIRAVKTGTKSGMGDVPVETVEIKSVRRMTADEVAKVKDGAGAKEPAKDGTKK